MERVIKYYDLFQKYDFFELFISNYIKNLTTIGSSNRHYQSMCPDHETYNIQNIGIVPIKIIQFNYDFNFYEM